MVIFAAILVQMSRQNCTTHEAYNFTKPRNCQIFDVKCQIADSRYLVIAMQGVLVNISTCQLYQLLRLLTKFMIARLRSSLALAHSPISGRVRAHPTQIPSRPIEHILTQGDGTADGLTRDLEGVNIGDSTDLVINFSGTDKGKPIGLNSG